MEPKGRAALLPRVRPPPATAGGAGAARPRVRAEQLRLRAPRGLGEWEPTRPGGESREGLRKVGTACRPVMSEGLAEPGRSEREVSESEPFNEVLCARAHLCSPTRDRVWNSSSWFGKYGSCLGT